MVAIENGRLNQARYRPGRSVANRKRFDHVVAFEHRPHAVEEFDRINLRTVTVKKPLDKHQHRDRANEQNQTQHQSAAV